MKHINAEFIKLFVDGVEIEGCHIDRPEIEGDYNDKWFLVTKLTDFDHPSADEFRVKPKFAYIYQWLYLNGYGSACLSPYYKTEEEFLSYHGSVLKEQIIQRIEESKTEVKET